MGDGQKKIVLLKIHKTCRWRYTFHPPRGYYLLKGDEKGDEIAFLKCGRDDTHVPMIIIIMIISIKLDTY